MTTVFDRQKEVPSIDAWLSEARSAEENGLRGMYLTHMGVVRQTARARVRDNDENAPDVKGMVFNSDSEKAEQCLKEAAGLPGITYARVWLNAGELKTGDPIMCVLIGGDTRPHVVDALQFLVQNLKEKCVSEAEIN